MKSSCPGGRQTTPDPTAVSFESPVRFDAEHSALVFPARELERPVPGADFRMRATLEEAVSKYWTATLPNVTDNKSCGCSTRASFSATPRRRPWRAPCGCIRVRSTAARRAERTTFRKLLNKARFDMAQQLLAGTRMDVSGISGALGYAEFSAFTHAFRRMGGHLRSSGEQDWRKPRSRRRRPTRRELL